MIIEASTIHIDKTLKEIMNGEVSPSLDKKLKILGPILGSMFEEQRIATANLASVSQPHIYGRNIMVTKLLESDLIVEVYEINGWNFPVIVHDGIIINLTKAHRFRYAQKTLYKEQGVPHHTACLARKFNKNVPLKQGLLFSEDNEAFEEKVQEKVNFIMKQMSIDEKTTVAFASVVIQTAGDEIVGAYLMALDANMEFCGKGINLAPYFNVEMPVVVETAVQPAPDVNISPNDGVQLSKKALGRLAGKRRNQLNLDNGDKEFKDTIEKE